MKKKLPEKSQTYEKIIFFLICLVILSLTLVSFIFGLVKTPAGMEFLGRRAVNIQDTYPAVSLIEQAKQGKLIFQNVYSTDTNSFIVSPVYLFLGRLGLLLPVSDIVLFHLGRIILGFILLWLLHQFLRLFFEKVHLRILAFLITALSGGVGFFTYKSISGSYDLFLPTANLFLSLFESPQLIFEEILLLFSLQAVLQIVSHQRLSLKQTIFTVVSSVLLLITLFYSLPQYTIAVSVLPVLISLAPQLVLIFISWKTVSRQANTVKLAVLSLVVFFLPTPFQRLSFFALFLFSSILAAYGFFHVYDRFIYPYCQKNKAVKFASYFLIAVFIFGLLPITNYFHIYWDVQTYAKDKNESYMNYLLKEEMQALYWLKSNTPKETIILTKPFYGNIIGGLTGRKIYLGNDYYTANSAKKTDDINAFLASWDDAKRKDYLKQNHITYLFFGKDDSMLAESFKPKEADYLKEVYSQNGVTIYELTEEKKQPRPISPSITKAPQKKISPRK